MAIGEGVVRAFQVTSHLRRNRAGAIQTAVRSSGASALIDARIRRPAILAQENRIRAM